MQVRNINLLTWGVDLVEEHLFSVVGIPARPQKAKEPLAAISEMAYNAPKSGRMKDLSFIDEWKANPKVVSARPLVAAGELVTGPEDGMPTWYAEIVVSFPNGPTGVKDGMDMLYAIDAQWRKDGGARAAARRRRAVCPTPSTSRSSLSLRCLAVWCDVERCR